MPTDRSAQDQQAEVDQLMADYRASRERLDETHRELAGVTGEARSEDGAVRVLVGPRGVLRELTLGDDAYRRFRPAELASTIVRLTGQAAATAAERTAAVLADALPSGADPELLLGAVAGSEPEPAPAARPPRPVHDDVEDEDFSQTSWLESGPTKRT